MDIGIDVEPPKKRCEDRNCPYHGTLKVRGQMIKGRIVADRMTRTAVVERNYLRHLKKYERYEKRRSRYLAHNPECIAAKVGDEVTIMGCRPISKAKSFVVIGKTNAVEEIVEDKAEETAKSKMKAHSKAKATKRPQPKEAKGKTGKGGKK